MQQYSPLLATISKVLFQKAKLTKEELDSKVLSQTLTLASTQYRGTYFVSDLNHTIQLLLPNPNINSNQSQMRFSTSPFSFLQSSIYKKIDKDLYNFWEPYNCSQDLFEQEPPQFERPYNPAYFMGTYYQEFKVQKGKLSEVLLTTKEIKVFQWKVKIVNVSKTGWYAPVLEALHYKIDQKKKRQNYNKVQLVLYQPEIKDLMEKLRLNDIRILKKESFEECHQVSLFYYLIGRSNHKKITNIVKVDQRKQICQFQQKKRVSYLPTNQVSGLVISTEKIDLPPIKTQKVKDQSTKEWKILMSGIKPPRQRPSHKQENMVQELMDWSESSSSQQQVENPPKIQEEMVEEAEELVESEEEEDILRKLYQEQLNITTIRIL